MIDALILISRQGKVRLTKFYKDEDNDVKLQQRLTREISSLVLKRPNTASNILEFSSRKVIYKRYASLYFITIVNDSVNDLLILEKIHFFVEILDKYFGNVCELDIIFNFHKAYYLLDEVILNGQIQETSKKEILKMIRKMDEFAEAEEDRMRQKMTIKKLLR